MNYSLQPDSSQTLVRGIVLLNCAGGMNNKAIVDDWRIKLLLPLLWLIDFLLKQKGIASAIFERVKQRYSLKLGHNFPQMFKEATKIVLMICRENLRNVLSSVYGNKESVDEELVEVILCCLLVFFLISLSFQKLLGGPEPLIYSPNQSLYDMCSSVIKFFF